MPDAAFESLRLELLRSGVAPLYVERTIVELGEHYVDLESAALAAGLERRRSGAQRARHARQRTGSSRRPSSRAPSS